MQTTNTTDGHHKHINGLKSTPFGAPGLAAVDGATEEHQKNRAPIVDESQALSFVKPITMFDAEEEHDRAIVPLNLEVSNVQLVRVPAPALTLACPALLLHALTLAGLLAQTSGAATVEAKDKDEHAREDEDEDEDAYLCQLVALNPDASRHQLVCAVWTSRAFDRDRAARCHVLGRPNRA